MRDFIGLDILEEFSKELDLVVKISLPPITGPCVNPSTKCLLSRGVMVILTKVPKAKDIPIVSLKLNGNSLFLKRGFRQYNYPISDLIDKNTLKRRNISPNIKVLIVNYQLRKRKPAGLVNLEITIGKKVHTLSSENYPFKP